MQVFLPYASFSESLRCLDKRRLAKQRVEAKQLIDVILGRPTASGKPRKGWSNHPAAVMFRRYLPALIEYYNLSLCEHVLRGGKNEKLQPEDLDGKVEYPWWIGVEEVHASHRSRLLMKGKIDLVAERIRNHSHDRSANRWLKTRGFPPLNECRMPDHDRIHMYLNKINAPHITKANYYEQFGWTDDPTIEYSWPGETPEDGIRVLR